MCNDDNDNKKSKQKSALVIDNSIYAVLSLNQLCHNLCVFGNDNGMNSENGPQNK